MDQSSPFTEGLLEFLGEETGGAAGANSTTLLRQGQVGQEWLLRGYLAAWLELIGGLVIAEYPQAMAFRAQLRALGRLADSVNPALSVQEQLVFLNSVQTHIKSTLRQMGGYPEERSLQWGIWARDVPLAIAAGFDATDFLDPIVCEELAPCCMYAAFLVSQVVEDDGVADEIEDEMFEDKPRALLELLRAVPVAPEA